MSTGNEKPEPKVDEKKDTLVILKNEIDDLERDVARLYRMVSKFKGILESRGDFDGAKAFARKE